MIAQVMLTALLVLLVLSMIIRMTTSTNWVCGALAILWLVSVVVLIASFLALIWSM